jgi:ornithine cyclodeaminase/alanine dehydrogenase
MSGPDFSGLVVDAATDPDRQNGNPTGGFMARRGTTMRTVEFLYLSQEDVMAVGLTMEEAIAIIEDVLREHGLKHVENPPKPGVHPLPDAFIHAMPGYLPRKEIAGLKWVSGFSSNFKYNLPSIMGLMVLNDVKTGQPLAVMDCRWITAIRTGAVSAVAAKFLAKRDAEVIGIVGAGVQGRMNLLALREVLYKTQRVRVFDVNQGILQHYVDSMSQKVPFKIEAGASAREVIVGADVVVTATGRLEKPIYQERWIKAGALVLPVHTRGWGKQTLSKVDKFIVDDWQQFSQAQEAERGFYGSLPKVYAELGEIIVGRKPGREKESERIIDFNYGMAIDDVAMAREIYIKAKARGLGAVLPLMKGDAPFF